MNYYHRFRVRASLARVAEFHSHAASMPAITPPPIIVQVHHAIFGAFIVGVSLNTAFKKIGEARTQEIIHQFVIRFFPAFIFCFHWPES